MRAATFKPTAPLLVAALLAVLHLSFSLGVNPPGYLTYDSGTYHYMAKTFAETGEKPALTEGKNFFDTGVALITDKPVDGVPSISVAEGLELCWG